MQIHPVRTGTPEIVKDRRTPVPTRPAPTEPTRAHRVMRKYQISYLDTQGRPCWTEQIGPASPHFEAAFSAFAHGVPIVTPDGPVAVQDLVPGMRVSTQTRGPMRVLWIGAMTLVPQAPGNETAGARMTRVMPDAFGLGKPEANLMVGPGARLLSRPRGQGHDRGPGCERLLVPAGDLVDGMNIVDVTPPRPVTVYHVALRQHAILQAAGLDMESFHPGAAFERHMGPKMLALFLSLFPHVSKPADFGKMACPRLDLPQG